MKPSVVIFAGTLGLASAAIWHAHAADSAAQPVRTLIERHDQSGVPGKEIVMGSAVLPPGSSVGFHTHPGDEAGFILKGTIVWKVQGQPDRTLHAGDSFFNPRGTIHAVATQPGSDGGTAVSSWIIDKGAPLASPAP
jgi:quercetin dioxygenase-like cupin family protein